MSEKEAPRQSFAANGRANEISPEDATTPLGVSTRTVHHLVIDQ